MFILKFFIFLLILFAVLYNGLVILNTPNMETAEKVLGITLYLIIVIVIANYTISYITYHHTKNKRGIVGDSGIEGQKGDKGKPGVCEQDCGRKICFINVKDHANRVLNTDLDKIKGTVTLKYLTDNPEKALERLDKNKSNLISKLIIKYGVLSMPSNDKGDVDKNFLNMVVKKDSVLLTISNSKTIVDGIFNDFYNGKQNNRKYLDIYIDGIVSPSIVIEDIKAISKCVEESSDEYVPKENDTQTNEKIEVEICKNTLRPTSNSDEESNVNAVSKIGSNEATKFTSIMNKKLKIRNEFFIEKIQKICNSNEYIKALEKKSKNKITEEKLIEYIKQVIEEMVTALINFKVRKVKRINESPNSDEADAATASTATTASIATTASTAAEPSRDNKNNDIIYAGLNFLLTKDADKNYFNIYKTGPDDYDIITSPINELEKYDIFRWGESYINSPLIIEKCDQDYKLPKGKEQDLVIVNTNKYKFIYSSKERDSVHYTGYQAECDTYCPFNQMGEDKLNKEDKQVCIYYNINEKSHRNLKGTHPVWAEVYYPKSPPLSLFHLETNGYLGNDGVVKQKYFQDSNYISYFPVGSVWTSRTDLHRKKTNTFSPNTHNKASGHKAVGPEKETILLSGNIIPPVDYNKIWNSKEGCIDCQTEGEITIWEPVPPKGYVCMGHLASDINNKTELLDLTTPETSPIMCVAESCVVKIPVGPQVWNSQNLCKKIFGPETFEPADRFILFLNCYLKENNFRTSEEILGELDTFIQSEKDRLRDYNKDTDTEYSYVDQDTLLMDLVKLKDMKLFSEWDKSKITKLYRDTNEILTMAKNIEEKYQRRFNSLKDLTVKELKKMKLKITPKIFSTKPVFIYSAGADKAYEESINMPDKQIKNDQGHNLFLAVTDKSKAPKFAYKINRECLYQKKFKPVELNTVPGVLNYPGAGDSDRKNKSSELYFTYPKDLILESTNSEFSPTKEPKRYYLSFSNKRVDIDNNKPPLYFIRAPNVKLRDFSECKVGTPQGQIINDVFDTKNANALFIIEDSETNNIIKDFSNVLNNENMFVKLRNSGVENEDGSMYFQQFYSQFGKNVEKLSLNNSGSNLFKIKRVI